MTGGFPVVAALATLAYDGRRAAYFRRELILALEIIDRGHVTPERMIGSWAGAMGQTQFMPSSFRSYAVDHDGDGRIDLWNSRPDVLGVVGDEQRLRSGACHEYQVIAYGRPPRRHPRLWRPNIARSRSSRGRFYIPLTRL